MNFEYLDIAKMIDHALLTPTLREPDLIRGCQMAVAYDVASVCIMPYYVRQCAELLADSSVAPSTTIGFPNGGHTTRAKEVESEVAIADGCEELDMVVNISKVLSEDWDYVRRDIQVVIDVAHAASQKVKVIFENCYLEDSHKRKLCEICTELSADWVKTSTGFGTGGATIEDLKLMCDCVPENVQVKAAGGVRDMQTAIQVRELGVTRIGTSRTVGLLDECRTMLELPPIDFTSEDQGAGY